MGSTELQLIEQLTVESKISSDTSPSPSPPSIDQLMIEHRGKENMKETEYKEIGVITKSAVVVERYVVGDYYWFSCS